MRRAGGWRPAGGAGAGPARRPSTSFARGTRGNRAGKGGAKGNGENGAGPLDPSPRRGRRRLRLIGPGSVGRDRSHTRGPCGLATHPAVPSLAAPGVPLGFGVGRAGRKFSRVNTARAASPGCREVWADSTARHKDLSPGRGGGATSQRGRFRCPRLAGLIPSRPLPQDGESSQFQALSPLRSHSPTSLGGSSIETHFILKFHTLPPQNPPSVRPSDFPQTAPSAALIGDSCPGLAGRRGYSALGPPGLFYPE